MSVDVTTDPRRRLPRGRTVLTAIVGLAAIVGLFASVVGIWSKYVLFDSATVAAAVDNALDEPEVSRALATWVTDEAFRAVDVDGRVEQVLPGPIQVLGPAITGGARALVIDRVDRRLANGATREVISGVVERAHAGAVRVLRGEPAVPGVRVEDDAVVVNMLPVVGAAIDLLPELGIVDRLDLPPLEPTGDPAEQIAALEASTGLDLPDDLGQLVVYRDDSVRNASAMVATARDAIALFERAVILIVVATIGLLVATVVLARRRRRAVLLLAITSVSVVVVLRAVLQRVIEEAPLTVLDPAARSALRSSLVTMSAGLFAALSALLLLGVVAAVWAFVTGPSDRAAAIRRSAGASGRSFGATVRAHPEGVATAAGAGALLAILVGGLRPVALIVAVLLLIAALWVWARGTGSAEETTG